MLELSALIIACILNLLLGYIVYSKNPDSSTNKLFLALTTSFIAWSCINYISVHPFLFSQLTWARMVLSAAALLCLLVFLTFTTFPSRTLQGSKRIRRTAIGYTIGVIFLAMTPAFFRSLEATGGNISPDPGVGIPLFALLIVLTLGGGILTLIKKYRRSIGAQRTQFLFVLVGLSGTFGLIFFTNFVLVVGFKNSSLISFGPTYTLIFTGTLAYAIIKHHLFDIRQAAARGVGYALTIVALAAVYSSMIFGVTSVFLNTGKLTLKVQIVYILLALVLAFTFQPIKRFFDRVSNRIFFKDSYDPQQFMKALNTVLVDRVELDQLLKNSCSVIRANLKTSSCSFVIDKTAYFPVRIISNPSNAQLADPQKLLAVIEHTQTKVIASDVLDIEDAEDAELAAMMSDHNVAVIIKLVPNLHHRSANVGSIMLGPKQSGDAFTSQDIKILDIVANELVLAIQNALRFEEINNFNTTLQQKVNNATRMLRSTNDRLRQLDESKDDFISMASHQLRTPLTSIKGYISMVLEGDAGKVTPMQGEMLGQAFFSSQRMVYLISDLLNVSRLKTGKFVIEATQIDLVQLVQQELRQLKEAAASRSLTLSFEFPKDFPTLMFDETKTRQVIMNFVDNAIYYTPAGGHITVRLVSNPSTVELRVEDNGIGVPKHEQHHMFTKFYRAGNARQARPDGTGLGLFMAKKVIIAQGGAVIFDSVEGQGSTFGFIFSKAKLAIPLADTSIAAVTAKPAKLLTKAKV